MTYGGEAVVRHNGDTDCRIDPDRGPGRQDDPMSSKKAVV
jgi:hypothetical protein